MGMPPTQRKSPTATLPVDTADSPNPDRLAPGTCAPTETDAPRARELGGPAGPEPTRFGDWEKNGRCIDF